MKVCKTVLHEDAKNENFFLDCHFLFWPIEYEEEMNDLVKNPRKISHSVIVYRKKTVLSGYFLTFSNFKFLIVIKLKKLKYRIMYAKINAEINIINFYLNITTMRHTMLFCYFK